MGLIFKDVDNKPVDPKAARLRAILLSTPLALMGLAALILLMHDGLLGGLNRQKAMGLLSAAVVCGGLIALIFGINAKKQALTAPPEEIAAESPWLKRKEWTESRLMTTVRKSVLLLWIFVAFWCAGSAVIALAVVPQQMHQGNHLALLALIIPLIGLTIVVLALNTTLAWRKFNRTVFQMAAFPASPGGVLAGKIVVPARLKPEHGLHVRVTCVRRAVTGPTNNLRTTDKVLWEDEKWLRANLPQTGGTTEIPVYFALPDKLPESTVTAGDGTHWKLEASAKLDGPNFQAAFEVPVFKVAELPAVEDGTAPYQMSLDEIRKQIHSNVQVKDLGEGGKEFFFPAGRNPGFASGATAVCVVWTAIIVVLVVKGAPVPFQLVFGAIDLLMMAFVADLWFRCSRVAVNAKGVTVQQTWFGFKKEQRFSTGDISRINSEVGATAGHAVYHDLKVVGRDGKEFLLAKHLNNKPEADWLVRQMTEALKARAEAQNTKAES